MSSKFLFANTLANIDTLSQEFTDVLGVKRWPFSLLLKDDEEDHPTLEEEKCNANAP